MVNPAVTATSGRWHAYLLPALGLLIFTAVIYTLHHTLQHLSWAEVVAQVHSISGKNLLLGCLLAASSYLVLCNYDRLAVRYLGKSVPFTALIPLSFTAFAIGHNVGVAALSGGSIRYRAYSLRDFSATEIATIIGFCTLTFFLGASLLLGVALIFEPVSVFERLKLPATLMRSAGALLCLVPVVYLVWAAVSRPMLNIRGWSFNPPTLRIAFGQILTGSLDLILAASIIYIFLPAGTAVTFPAYLSAYLVAMGVGVVSSVPGGIGVFEGLMLLQLPAIPQTNLLGAILLFRVIYYAIPLFIAATILCVQEVLLRKNHLHKMASRAGLWVGQAAPQVLGVLVFLMGATLLLSGSSNPIGVRMEAITQVVSLPLIEASHMLNSLTGVALLFVARGLYRRLNGAYHLTIWLLVAGIAFSLLKGLDYEEAGILALALLFIWLGRAEFHRTASLLDQRFTPAWLFSIALVVGGSVWLGMFVYRHIEYQDSMWWQFALDGNAPRMLRGSLVAICALVAFGFLRLLRPTPPEPTDLSAQELIQAKALAVSSDRSLANVALLGDKRILFNEDLTAFIMYQISGGSWIALGDPVGDDTQFESLIWKYRELCDRHSARCVFYQVTQKYLPQYLDVGLSLSKLGEDARVSLPEFSLQGGHRAEFRQARSRASRENCLFEVVPAESVPAIMAELATVSDCWLATKSAHEKGFSLGTFDPVYLANFDCAVVKKDGVIVAFANLWRAGSVEISVDLMRFSDAAPKGIMDFLFIETILYGQAQGYSWFSLGMAPLSGLEHHELASTWHKIGNTIFERGESFYNFEGLRAFKDKFDPEWEPCYLAAPGGLATPQVLFDATILISGGLKEIFVH